MDNDHPRARLYYLFNAAHHPQGTSWLARLPAGMFAIPVALFGLNGAWRRAAAYGWPFAAKVSTLLVWPVTGLWLLLLLLYAMKCKRHPHAVLREFHHPVQGPLQALIPLSLLLAVIQFGRPDQGIWLVLAALALGVNAVTALRTASILVTGRMPPNAVTPALYLPVVGAALIGSMAFANLGATTLAALLFGTGISGWVLLETRIMNSLFQARMPDALRPTIGIELMPAVVATLSAASIWPNLPATMLAIGWGVAMVPLICLLVRYRQWTAMPFSLGCWSFSFPLAILASAALEVAWRGGWPLWFGQATLLAASAIAAYLLLRTVVLLLQRKLLSAD